MALLPSDAARVQQLFELLQTTHKGDALVELIDNLQAAVEAVTKRRKPAQLTLKINLTPGKGEEIDIMHISMSTSVKLPAVERGSSTFFAWSDNSIRRQRELQASMFDEDKPRLVTGTVIRAGETYSQAREAQPFDQEYPDLEDTRKESTR